MTAYSLRLATVTVAVALTGASFLAVGGFWDKGSSVPGVAQAFAGGGGAAAGVEEFEKDGFEVDVEDGRLWVLRSGDEKSEKHDTMIAAGPRGMSVKALNRDTASEYLASKPGFDVEIEDGRLWVLRSGQEKSEKHATLIGAGPQGLTVKALDRETALEYLGSKPGFDVDVEDGRLWVLTPGQEKSEKHATAIGAGPLNTSVKALDQDTLNAYAKTKVY